MWPRPVSSSLPLPHLGVVGDDFEGLLDLLGRGSAADVQEVGRVSAVQLDDVHGGHGQAGAVHQAADVACRGGRGRYRVRAWGEIAE